MGEIAKLRRKAACRRDSQATCDKGGQVVGRRLYSRYAWPDTCWNKSQWPIDGGATAEAGAGWCLAAAVSLD
ncbi:UNVERIFIED_CONTAM: hypothetical protein Sradi_4878100 [Sesamum radiatum]|uniref:Uncharacterized protein n=1 Tax=Sesamum radiatum TaxID=300843 RepID=A0AAW2MY54_SESRA